MLPKLTRILLALVTALVFTGQMEAAAQHCARLAHEAASIEHTRAPDRECHEPAPAAAHGAHHAAPSEAPPAHDPAHDPASHTTDHCACVAALNGFTSITGARASNVIAHHVWQPLEAGSFVSRQPDPDLRPPRD
jgi:hypothetical protein